MPPRIWSWLSNAGVSGSGGSDPFLNLRFVILCGLMLFCLLAGGSSRQDAFQTILIYPSAVVAATLALLMSQSTDLRRVRLPLMLLGGLAIWIALQLVPLPPTIWTKLSGQGPFVATAEVVGGGLPWRPISVVPDQTLGSLVALTVPAGMLVILGTLPPARTYLLLPLLIVVALAGAALGGAQFAGGARSPLYLYEITNRDSAVGFFANRNHHALLLVTALPMLALWAVPATQRDTRDRLRVISAFVITLLLLIVIGAAVARVGLVLSIPALVLAFLVIRGRLRSIVTSIPRRLRLIALLAVFALAAVVVVILLSSDAAQRLLLTDFAQEQRTRFTPLVIDIAWLYFPWGSGFGTFDPVFRMNEPFEFLKPTYFNHAHNDFLEFVLTGGLPALIVLLAFLYWSGFRTVRSFTAPLDQASIGFARLGSAIVLLLFAASLADYPLRTPALSALFTLACYWLSLVEDSAPPLSKVVPVVAD